MSNIKYVFCDIDGTLILNREPLPLELKQLVNQLEARDVKFTFASGRLPYMIEPLLIFLELSDRGFVACNGALVKEGGQVLFNEKFAISALQSFIKEILAMNMTVLYAIDEEEFLLAENTATIRKRQERGNYHPLREIDESEWLKLKITKLNILTDDSPNDLTAVKAQIKKLSQKLHITRYGNHGLEIVAAGVNKKTGVKQLLAREGLDFSQVMALGDNENDLELIKSAKRGVVVANGTEELKRISDQVTTNSAVSGVCEALQQLLDEIGG